MHSTDNKDKHIYSKYKQAVYTAVKSTGNNMYLGECDSLLCQNGVK